MILLWGIAGDGPLAAVRARLEAEGAALYFFDQAEMLRCALRLNLGRDVGGRLETPAGRLDLATVTAVYLRTYDTRRVLAHQDVNADDLRMGRALALEDAFIGWTELTEALVVNRPSAMASNNSKPFQLEVIRETGFAVPETLITTDAAAAEEFWGRHEGVIYKSLSGVRSIVTRVGPDHRERLADLAACPTQFQQYIAGTDVRVHVLGDETFACEVESDAIDYRYPQRTGSHVSVRPCDLPSDVAARCILLARTLDLPFAGIDLRRTPDGNWYGFEANPSPGFTYYEEAAGQPISAAVAALLMRAR